MHILALHRVLVAAGLGYTGRWRSVSQAWLGTPLENASPPRAEPKPLPPLSGPCGLGGS